MKLASRSWIERLGRCVPAALPTLLLTAVLAPTAAGQSAPPGGALPGDALRAAAPPRATVTVPTVPNQGFLGPTRFRSSVEYGGPSMSINGIREGSVIVPSGGITLGPGAPPIVDITVADLGLTPVPANCMAQPGMPCRVEVDALSAGEDTPFPEPAAAGKGSANARVWYSVDEWASGFNGALVFPNVDSEGNAAGVFDASADSFISLMLPPTPVPPPAMPTPTVGSVDGNGLPSMSGALYPGIGLREPNPPAMGALDVGDNLDALDVNSPAGFPAGGFYYSLDGDFMDPLEGIPNSGSAIAQGFTGGDVLNVASAGATPTVYAPAALLGLDSMGVGTDDLDGLILAENGMAGFQPSINPHDWVGGMTDMLIFSVRRGSAVVGMQDSIFGVPIEEGDLLTTPMGGAGTPGIFIAAEALGLATVRSGQPVVFGDDLCGGDYTDLAVRDCTNSGVEDAAEIATGDEQDADMNGIPDSCRGTLGGTDSCTSGQTDIGFGDLFGLPFVTGTTGAAGQAEANCYAFGTSGIDNDVWFAWGATVTGIGTVTTCAGTTVDTKVAVWPGVPGCPADGTSLACNDDSCGLQSSASFPISAGSSYTIQLGTFPGGAGGSGSFDVTQGAPSDCGTYDDGTSENALGLTAGGEMGWLHNQECLITVDRIETAYGSPTGTSPPNGVASRLAVYEDFDCDRDPTTPATGMLLAWSLSTTVTNSGTDILNNYPTGGVAIPSRCSWVMATCDQAVGEFGGPMDVTNPTPKAWVVGDTTGPGAMDLNNLNNNDVAPLQLQAIGFPAAWLLRASGTESPPPGPSSVCHGDGSGGICGCGNDGGIGEGCANSTGAGAMVFGGGVASLSNDSFTVTTTQIPNSPGLTFQANIALANPPTFGDGLRCCGNNVVRWITLVAQGNCAATDQSCGVQVGGIGGPISQHPGNTGLQAGDTRCYQHWYRDPGAGNPCQLNFFNLSPAILATWAP